MRTVTWDRTRTCCVARGRALACLDKGYNPLCQRGIKLGLPHAAGALLALCLPGTLSAELFQWIPSSIFHGWGGYWGAFLWDSSRLRDEIELLSTAKTKKHLSTCWRHWQLFAFDYSLTANILASFEQQWYLNSTMKPSISFKVCFK